MLLSWWCCRLLAYLINLPHPPSCEVNLFAVFDVLGKHPNWGRQVVFVHWLVGVFGHEQGKLIWMHIRRQRKHSCSQQYHVSERSDSPV